MYVDLEKFLAAKLPEIKKQEEKDAISDVLAAASSFVDLETKRGSGYFNVSPNDPTVRRFRGDGTRILRIPAHVKGSVAVENIPLSAWYESEKNGWLYKYETGQVEPFVPQYDGYPIWTKNALYNVAARYGFAEIPPEIVEAVSQITMRWWQTQKGTFGQITPNGFVIERDVPLSARTILEAWTKGEFEI